MKMYKSAGRSTERRESMNMSKCTRCAMESGFNPLEDDRRCIWKAAGTVCPDYDEMPDMNSIACEKVPNDETEILRRHMRLLAEKSRFRSAADLVPVADAMLKLHRRLTIQPFLRFLRIQILLSAAICIFTAFGDFIQRRR